MFKQVEVICALAQFTIEAQSQAHLFDGIDEYPDYADGGVMSFMP